MRYRTWGAAVAMITALAASLEPLAAQAGEKNGFFNGKDLDGWEGKLEYWSVKDGAIVGSTPKGLGFNTFLCSKKKYGNFELKFQVKLAMGKGNSGVQIRSGIINPKTFAVGGPQCDMGQVYWGSLYGEHYSPGKKIGEGGGMMKAADAKLVKKILKENEFNDYYIKCVDKHVTIKLNGETTVDADFKMPATGIIAWQLHAGGPMEVTFKYIQFTPLDAAKKE